RLSLARQGAWKAGESLDLPEGEHRYTLRSSARARCFPEGGAFPFVVDLTGSGTGKVLVTRGTRLILNREACEGRHYTARLEPCKGPRGGSRRPGARCNRVIEDSSWAMLSHRPPSSRRGAALASVARLFLIRGGVGGRSGPHPAGPAGTPVP